MSLQHVILLVHLSGYTETYYLHTVIAENFLLHTYFFFYYYSTCFIDLQKGLSFMKCKHKLRI